MEYQRFRELIKGKEKANVDFKLECDAFKGKTTEPKAELAKDICALANNANTTSYILIGVSDDGRHFKSVENEKLTDDNLQVFCKKAIFPPPRVKLLRKSWPKASSEKHKAKTFVIIQVGRQARRAYRLNQDFIAYKEKVCYRRNEVWIRRGATSDLATPEETSNLVRALPFDEIHEAGSNIVYSRLPRDGQISSLRADVDHCIKHAGAKLHAGRVVLKVRRTNVVLRLLVVPRVDVDYDIWDLITMYWTYEHGVLIVALQSFPRKSLTSAARIESKETWGWFSVFDIDRHRDESLEIPLNISSASPFILTLPPMKDSSGLHRSFQRMIDFLHSDDQVYDILRAAKKNMNANLRRWLKQGWIFRPDREERVGEAEEPGKYEEINGWRFDEDVVKRCRIPRLERAARNVLSLS